MKRLKNRQLTALAPMVAFSLIVAACGDDDNEASSDDTATSNTAPAEDTSSSGGCGSELTVGLIAPTTGRVSVLGEGFVSGVRLAIDEVNESGGIDGTTVKLEFRDSAGDLAQAASIAREFVDSNDIRFVLGPIAPQLEASAVEYFTETETLNIGAGYIRDEYGDDTSKVPYSFTVAASYDAALDTVERYLENNGLERVAILAQTAGSGLEWEERLTASDNPNYEVVADEQFDVGQTDLTSQVRAIAESDPDAIMPLASGAGELGNAIQALEAAGLTQPLVGVISLATAPWDDLGDAADRAAFYSYSVVARDGDRPISEDAARVGRTLLDDGVGAMDLGLLGYGAGKLLADALGSAADCTPEAVKDILEEYEGDVLGVPTGLSPDNHFVLADDAGIVMLKPNSENADGLLQIAEGEELPSADGG